MVGWEVGRWVGAGKAGGRERVLFVERRRRGRQGRDKGEGCEGGGGGGSGKWEGEIGVKQRDFLGGGKRGGEIDV